MSPSRDLAPAFLVTGTDMGVGKTFIAAGLARMLRDRGLKVGVMKPIEVGWDHSDGDWPPDAENLREAADSDDALEDIVPYAFTDQLAPQLSADRLRTPIEPERIQASLLKMRRKYDVVVVEGVGGLAVPLDDGFDLASLAVECELPLLIVARAHVGTLNHTFLTVHYARSRGLEVLGIVANRLDTSVEDPSTGTNAMMMERMCKVPVLGTVPFRPEADHLDEIVDTCLKCFDLDLFLDRLGLKASA